MIELMMVMAVVSGMVAASLIGWAIYRDTARGQTAIGDAQVIIDVVERIYGYDFTGISDADVIASNLLPDNLTRTAGEINGSWGGQVSLSAFSTGGRNAGFALLFQGMPKTVCGDLLRSLEDSAYLLRLTLTTGNLKTRQDDLTIAEVNLACNSNDSSFAAIFWPGH